MTKPFTPQLRRAALSIAAALGLMLSAAVAAQDMPIDGDLARTPEEASSPAQASAPAQAAPAETLPGDGQTYNGTPMGGASDPAYAEPVVTSGDASKAASQAAGDPEVAAAQGDTYKKDDLIGAAEGVFGKGAEGLARMIESWLDKQGEPNAYIVGREGGGAVVVGLRYGSGTLYHKVEGQKPVYWTGPSIGFDVGANAGNTFVLVYNLYDTEDIYKRFPAAEGQLYVVGGFNASYLRSGDIVLIPIRMGAGLRLGINAGYMKIRKTQKWIPF